MEKLPGGGISVWKRAQSNGAGEARTLGGGWWTGFAAGSVGVVGVEDVMEVALQLGVVAGLEIAFGEELVDRVQRSSRSSSGSFEFLMACRSRQRAWRRKP